MNILIYLLVPIIIQALIVPCISKAQNFEKEARATDANAIDEFFEINPSTYKLIYLLIFICGIIFEVMGAFIGLAFYITEKDFLMALFVGLFFELIFLPVFIVGLYFYKRQIYFCKDKFIIKSIGIKKLIKLSEIKK